MSPCRIPQPSLNSRPTGANRAHAYDPNVESAGMTLDTDRGPVDLVAVERALSGELIALTKADVQYALGLLPSNYGPRVQDAAAGLGVSTDAVKRAVDRRRAATRDRTRP